MPSLNNDVKEMKARLNKLKTGNKQGVPFKRDVDIIKRRLVNRWKSERGRNLEKKVIRNQLNVTGVPKKLVTQYRNAATNYIMNNGPTMKQLEKYKKTWLNLRNK
jgi:adenylate kinase family enzyme